MSPQPQHAVVAAAVLYVLREASISTNRPIRINERIRVPEVRLIDDQNNQLGVLSLDAAQRIATEKGLDLV